MGERLNGAGHSRRRAHPENAADDASWTAPPALEALLGQALRGSDGRPDLVPDVGSDGERRAVAAFRAARDAGAHRTRTRRRDDWRPRARRHTPRPLRVTLSVLVAGLALGGVAYAAVGSSPHAGADGAGRPEPSATASGVRSAAAASASPRPGASADRDRPASAEDTEAQCRAYDKVQGRGQAMDATAWQRLVTAAGGEGDVAAYCAEQDALGTGKPAKAGRTPGAGKTPGAGATPKTGRTPEAEQSRKAARAEESAGAGKAAGTDETATGEKAAPSGAEGR